MGAANGVMTIVRGAIPAELYGCEGYGAINGAMATPALLAKAIDPTFAALTLAETGQAVAMLLWLAAVAVVSAAVFTFTVCRPVSAPAPFTRLDSQP
jgi:hypothetical protein